MRSFFLIIVLCLIALCGCSKPTAPQAAAGGRPSVPVSVAVATEETAPVEIHAIGTVEPSSIVQVKAQISGELLTVHFVEGANVNKGDLLFKIDPRPRMGSVSARVN